jgi:hypothetical protein
MAQIVPSIAVAISHAPRSTAVPTTVHRSADLAEEILLSLPPAVTNMSPEMIIINTAMGTPMVIAISKRDLINPEKVVVPRGLCKHILRGQ